MTITEKLHTIKNVIYIKNDDSDHLIINNKFNIEIKNFYDQEISQYIQVPKAALLKLCIKEKIIDLFCYDKIDDEKINSIKFSSFCSNFTEKDEECKGEYSNSFSNSSDKTSSKSFINISFSPKEKLEKKLRKSYYQKLISKNVISNNLTKKLNYNIFIYDWDDTLFPTTFLSTQNELTSETKEILENIESNAIEILNKSVNKGYVFIITNSNKGWVEDCSKKFYPNLDILLKKIDIISARDLYESEDPYNGKMWKEKTFFKIKEDFKLDKENLTNIICIGDSEFEIEAGQKLSKEFYNVVIKNIKLKHKPSLKELKKEIFWINTEISRLYSFSKNVSIELE